MNSLKNKYNIFLILDQYNDNTILGVYNKNIF